MSPSDIPGTPVKIDLDERHPINLGGNHWYWIRNHVYAYVFDEEENRLFAVTLANPTDEIMTACMEAYFDGHRHGRAEGQDAKLAEIRKALGIQTPNILR